MYQANYSHERASLIWRTQVVLLTTIVSFSNPYTRMGGTELVANVSRILALNQGRTGLTVFKVVRGM